ncbi:U11/U12 small nuclear ribonucleoprotein 65 kDa protein [Armadillidium vulgare]|nr:U11/U12 small nuclear ribonucleoprotein 65 kDa protein [Armadillidium vulgare]
MKGITSKHIFRNHVDCEYALRKLHQLDLFGKRISAQYFSASLKGKNTRTVFSDEGKRFSGQKENLFKYEAQLSAISSNFNVHNPISPKLRYSYPPPSPLVLSNIAHALVAVPKFYTQVLHLMNKMNLPCPFGPLTEEPVICKEAKLLTKVFDSPNKIELSKTSFPETADISSQDIDTPRSDEDSESELESDEEIKLMYNKEKVIPKKRMKVNSSKIRKRPKIETLKQSLLQQRDPTTFEPKDDSQALREVFEMSKLNPKRTLNVKVQGTLPDSEALAKDDEVIEEDWPVVPVFKNYNRGTPSPRIYIKNLSKTVTEYDLRYIFGRYVIPVSEDASHFNIAF